MNTIPTPRTDAEVTLTFAKGHNTVCPNFARQLERELAIEREDNRKLRDTIIALRDQLEDSAWGLHGI